MIFRLDVLDTQPGATGEAAILAPPADVHSEAQYLEWLGWAQMDPQVFQLMVVIARGHRGNPIFPRPRFIGPFADVLESVFKDFVKSMYDRNFRRSPDGPPAYNVRRTPLQQQEPLDLYRPQAL
jgi:hypothetical protein